MRTSPPGLRALTIGILPVHSRVHGPQPISLTPRALRLFPTLLHNIIKHMYMLIHSISICICQVVYMTGVYAWVISKCASIYIYIMFIYTRVYIGIYMSISNMYVYIIYMCSLKPGNCGGGEGWGGGTYVVAHPHYPRHQIKAIDNQTQKITKVSKRTSLDYRSKLT